ncbi:MAG: TPM domain-containing protein [Rhodospirillaceae bacterium]|nr:TPM domain-containing protein [Rhodospirillaceae bacterium]
MRPLALLFALFWAFTVQAAEISFPPLTGRVVDQAHVLSAGAVRSLDQKLADHEATTHQQVIVATVASLQGHDIAEYGYQLGRKWGIGEKDKNTGAILLVAPTEREVRIEVGYGLEGTLTDALSRAIIEQRIIPEFRAGRMEGGIIAGTDAILGTLRGEAPVQPVQRRGNHREDPGEIPPVALIVIFIVFLLLTRGGGRRGYLPGVMLGGPSIWRGGGDGGFSGGGGSFGGGGASGKW